MPNYSVECAQPYDGSGRHEEFAVALRSFLNHVNELGETASTVLLVDDKSYPDHDFNFDDYARWLRSNGFEPDLVARESEIVDACDQVLDVLDFGKLKPDVAGTLQSDNKYTSQLFIASWCLVRLGYIQTPSFKSELRADRLVNILPASFKMGEDESLDIIKATPFAEAADKIEYNFITEKSE